MCHWESKILLRKLTVPLDDMMAPYIAQTELAPSYPLSWDKATPTLRNHRNLVLSNACLECVCSLKTIHGGGLVGCHVSRQPEHSFSVYTCGL